MQTETITETIKFSELPHYLTVKKITDVESDNVRVEVESTIHTNRVVKMPNNWSIDFVQAKPRQFQADILAFVVNRYGLKPQPVRYS